jgi:glycosyltransferase involved in cell wall biosynthesis
LELPQSRTSISIIVPVHNEERRIEPCIKRLLSYCKEKDWDFELIIVQDDGTDNTTSIVKQFSLSENRIKMLNLPTRLGKGGSIISAVLNCNPKEYITYMDVDLSADPSELERLLPFIENYDVVIGSRILRGDLPAIKRPFYRSLLSNSYSKLFRIIFRIPIHDPQCGLKIFRKEIASKLFEEVTITSFAFDTDLIVKAFVQGLWIKEVPINWTHGPASKINILTEIRSMGLDMLSIWYHYHLRWRQDKKIYPQKKGSIFGRILFTFLSLSGEIQKRPLKYLRLKSEIVQQDRE